MRDEPIRPKTAVELFGAAACLMDIEQRCSAVAVDSHGYPASHSGGKPCVRCGKLKRHNNAFCSAECCKAHRCARRSAMKAVAFLVAILVSSFAVAQDGPKAELFRLHNSVRPFPFRYDAQLDTAAQQFAEYMNRTKVLHHEADGRRPDERMEAAGYRPSNWSENIAQGQRNAQEAHDDWMSSGGHRSNILSRDFKDIGFGRSGEFWVTCFGVRSGSSGTAPAPSPTPAPAPTKPPAKPPIKPTAQPPALFVDRPLFRFLRDLFRGR